MIKAKARKACTILVVDDDEIFRRRLMQAMEDRGLRAVGAGNVSEALDVARTAEPDRVVVDMKMPGDDGLVLVEKLHQQSPQTAVVVLTGYGSIANTKQAIKAGAVDYLTKPADADQILAAFGDNGSYHPADAEPGSEGKAPSLARVEWEHIQRVLTDCEGNISKAARVLGIHRRSLQRKLAKLPPMG